MRKVLTQRCYCRRKNRNIGKAVGEAGTLTGPPINFVERRQRMTGEKIRPLIYVPTTIRYAVIGER